MQLADACMKENTLDGVFTFSKIGSRTSYGSSSIERPGYIGDDIFFSLGF